MGKKLEKLDEFKIELKALKTLVGGDDELYTSVKKDHGNGDTMSSTKKDADTVSMDTSWDDY
jgi:hypothetical protein